MAPGQNARLDVLRNGRPQTINVGVVNRPTNEPVVLSYLVRGGRIVDVYLTTISELASRRSEFNALMRDGGAARVTEELQRRSASLLAG